MDDRRYIGLDALRGVMMLLGIVLHAAMLYLASPPPTIPMPSDRNNSVVFDVVFGFIHSFRMPTFFLVAGFFAALLVQRRGLRDMLTNRVQRVFFPWLTSLAIILPLTAVFSLNFWIGARYGTYQLIPDIASLEALAAEIKHKIGPDAERPSMAHLWFLYYLCMFYLMVPICRWVVRISLRYEESLRRRMAGPAAPIILAAWTALTLWPFKGGQVHEGFIFFMPHSPSLLYYGTFFFLGYAIHTYREFLQATVRYMPMAWLCAAVLFPLSLMASAADTRVKSGGAVLHLAAVLLNGLCTWALIYGFIGAAQRFFERPSQWISYLAQSAYWVYLVHLPIVMFAGWCLLPCDLPAILKFVLVCSSTAVLAFVTFHYAVQNSWVSIFLHGRRLRLVWPWVHNSATIKVS
jgi:glucans biosynthesis protein C